MYHNVVPDPRRVMGFTSLDTGVTIFRLLIGDTIADREWNPSVAIAFSEGNAVEDEAESLCPILLRRQPTSDDDDDEEEEEEAEDKEEDEDGDDEEEGEDEEDDEAGPESEWCDISVKTQEQLDKEFNGEEIAWTTDDLRKNLVEQGKHFPKHQAGDEDDEYAQLLKKMLKMCNVN